MRSRVNIFIWHRSYNSKCARTHTNEANEWDMKIYAFIRFQHGSDFESKSRECEKENELSDRHANGKGTKGKLKWQGRTKSKWQMVQHVCLRVRRTVHLFPFLLKIYTIKSLELFTFLKPEMWYTLLSVHKSNKTHNETFHFQQHCCCCWIPIPSVSVSLSLCSLRSFFSASMHVHLFISDICIYCKFASKTCDKRELAKLFLGDNLNEKRESERIKRRNAPWNSWAICKKL